MFLAVKVHSADFCSGFEALQLSKFSVLIICHYFSDDLCLTKPLPQPTHDSPTPSRTFFFLVSKGFRVSKLLGSNYNPNPNTNFNVWSAVAQW